MKSLCVVQTVVVEQTPALGEKCSMHCNITDRMYLIPDLLNILVELRTTICDKEIHDGDINSGEKLLLHSGQDDNSWCFVQQQN